MTDLRNYFHNNKPHFSFQDGNFGKAETILEKTLNSANEKNYQNGIICTYDMLATIALTLKDYEKAEEFLIRIIDRLLRHGAAVDDNLVVIVRQKSALHHTATPL